MGKFLAGLATAFAALVGGFIAWRKLVHERDQEDLRIVRPTMEEIEKYGQPSRARLGERGRKIGAFLMLIVGAGYTYIVLRYGQSAAQSPLTLTATLVFSAAGILSLAQGVFQPFGQISASLWHRWILTAAGVTGIGAGTYIGVSATVADESEHAEQMRQESQSSRNGAEEGRFTVNNLTGSPIMFEFDKTLTMIAPPGTTSIPLSLSKHTAQVKGRCGTIQEDSLNIEAREVIEITYWCGRRP